MNQKKGLEPKPTQRMTSKDSELWWASVEDEAEVDSAGVERKFDTLRDT